MVFTQLTVVAFALQHVQGAECRVGGDVGLALGVLEVPVDLTQWGETWVNHAQRLVGRLPEHCQQELHSFNVLWYSYFALSQTTLAPVIKVPHHWGSQALTAFLFPHERSYHCWVVQPCAVLLCESFSYRPNWTKLVFFAPMLCWNLLLGSLDFFEFFVIHSYPPRTALSRFVPYCSKKFWGSFAGPTACNKVCLPLTGCAGGQDSSQVPWQMVLISTTPTTVLLFTDACLIIHC